jgi:hypothetical protein
MQKWIQPPACFDQGLHMGKLWSFPQNRASKMRERHQLLSGLLLMSIEFQHPIILTKIEQHFGGFFHQIKVRQPIKRQDFYANRDPINQEVRLIFAWSGSKLWSLLKYSNVKLKNQKPIAVDVLFKAYPMVPHSCRLNLARRYL